MYYSYSYHCNAPSINMMLSHEFRNSISDGLNISWWRVCFKKLLTKLHSFLYQQSCANNQQFLLKAQYCSTTKRGSSLNQCMMCS